MKYTMPMAFFCLMICCQIHAQDITTLNTHLFTDDTKDLTFSFEYMVDADGENTISKTIFKNIISLSKEQQSDDAIVLNIEADSTTVTNPVALTDGEASMLYAMMGLNMKLKCNLEGQLIEVLNKEELVTEFKSGIQGMSNQQKEIIIQNMMAEDEALLFEKMYELNYGLLLKYYSKDLSAPFESRTDTVVESTAETPKMTIETIEQNTMQKERFTSRTTIKQKTEEFIKEDFGYEIINKAIASNTELLLTTDDTGLIQSLSSNTIVKNEGIVMKSNDKVVNEMKPITQYIEVNYTKIE